MNTSLADGSISSRRKLVDTLYIQIVVVPIVSFFTVVLCTSMAAPPNLKSNTGENDNDDHRVAFNLCQYFLGFFIDIQIIKVVSIDLSIGTFLSLYFFVLVDESASPFFGQL